MLRAIVTYQYANIVRPKQDKSKPVKANAFDRLTYACGVA
ncbi:hypothetical protein LPL9_1786 [Lacticaseibacillus paracasei]|uniref:Uncharacterized protein n=1 Tax=Lacticaseibacillus paracasei subsp. paracasei Lpp22 TaxID=1256221 RepID=A0A8E0IAZ3_LACPA|nr:hypothetical protein LPL9_1786 [Lacticaseibacillus paracasei]EPC30718.1 hypothetical protein Lpp22_1108 [Lacticaseibacillus paracasei subsp. paracasei Lpp22]